MNLFELSATLSLDTTDFANKVAAAQTAGEDLASGLGTSVDTISTDMSTLSQNMSDFSDNMDTYSEDIDGKSGLYAEAVKGFSQGVTEFVTNLIEDAIAAIGQFIDDSIKLASQSGTAAAKEYNQSVAILNASTNVMMQKAGEWLMPLATVWNQVLDMLTGITNEEKLTNFAEQLDSYRFDKIAELKGNLDSIFGLFEKYEAPSAEDAMGLGDMTANLESQADYWLEYAAVMDSLRAKDIDPSFLAEIADGSKESLQTLKTLDAADAAGLEEVQDAFLKAEDAKLAAATSMADTQLLLDDTAQDMIDTMVGLAASCDQSGPAGSGASATGQAIIDGLADQYPGVAAMVDQFNAKLAELGSGGYTIGAIGLEGALKTTNFRTLGGFGARDTATKVVTGMNATGLDYVPYNDYYTRLHEGEAVLTKQEADIWRGNTGMSSSGLTAVIASAVRDGMSGFAVYMDGHKVGNMVTETVSRNIAQKAHAGRYA